MKRIAIFFAVILVLISCGGCTSNNQTAPAEGRNVFSNTFQASWLPKQVSEFDLMRDHTVLVGVKKLLGMSPDAYTWEVPERAVFSSLYESKSRLVLYKEFEKAVVLNNEIDKDLISKIVECKASKLKAIFPVSIYSDVHNNTRDVLIRDPMSVLFNGKEFAFSGAAKDDFYRNESMAISIKRGKYGCPYFAFENEKLTSGTLFWPQEMPYTNKSFAAVFQPEKVEVIGATVPADEKVVINGRPAIKTFIADPNDSRLIELPYDKTGRACYVFAQVRDTILPGDGIHVYRTRQDNAKVVSDVVSEDEGPYAYFFYDNYNPIWELHFYAPGENYKKGGDVRGP